MKWRERTASLGSGEADNARLEGCKRWIFKHWKEKRCFGVVCAVGSQIYASAARAVPDVVDLGMWKFAPRRASCLGLLHIAKSGAIH